MSSVVQAAAVAVLAMGTGAATVSVMNEDIPDLAVPDVAWEPGAALDGKVFHTVDTVSETGEVLDDELHFRDGRFQSAMCQTYCDFGWSEYRTWEEDGVVHFTTLAICPEAPHTVVWYGTVIGDEVEFAGTWTTRRWYWTRQLNVTGAGSTTPPAAPAPSG